MCHDRQEGDQQEGRPGRVVAVAIPENSTYLIDEDVLIRIQESPDRRCHCLSATIGSLGGGGRQGIGGGDVSPRPGQEKEMMPNERRKGGRRRRRQQQQTAAATPEKRGDDNDHESGVGGEKWPSMCVSCPDCGRSRYSSRECRSSKL